VISVAGVDQDRFCGVLTTQVWTLNGASSVSGTTNCAMVSGPNSSRTPGSNDGMITVAGAAGP
jgi:hypothetical protein